MTSGNTPPYIVAAFEESTDPIFISDGAGTILYSNRAANALIQSFAQGDKSRLACIVPADKLDPLLAAEQHTCVEVKLTPPNLESGKVAIRQAVFAFDISSADPGSDLRIIILKSVTPQTQRVLEHEEFLSTVAHDLKNPLGALFGYADTLLDTPAGKGLNDNQKQVVSRMRATAARSIDMVRNYQQLSVLRSGGIFPSNKVTDLNTVVQSVIDYTWRENHYAPALEVRLSKDPLSVRVEKIHLDRVLSNLFGNALKYTPPEGHISINSGLEKTPLGEQAVFEIRNSAPIIAADEIPTLFDRYSRASSSSGTSGTGLGLYIVKYILNAVKGSVEVESNEKQGTLFRVRLPLANN